MKEKSNANSKYFAVLEKIIATRVEYGITQMNIADHLKLGEGGYFKLEKGRSKLDLKRLFEILEYLEISPEEFFKGIK
ncbi:helix-turn-helix domain-containing protein [Polaribacter sp. ALD11]|uniref:helix-turn-helix domain-containing protein n=1 Tax=Polaribacter sp. ALD11 TaxID=2058137 RepID=UPI0018E1F2AD|nr:helix-turn-helix transcriptional regulator [Polaribacter sp. ALD11]